MVSTNQLKYSVMQARVDLDVVLIQGGRPFAYSSWSLTEDEQRYTQNEKEMLSIVHAYQKFHSYIFGKEATV